MAAKRKPKTMQSKSKKRAGKPTLKSLRGIARGALGARSSTEVVERSRDEWHGATEIVANPQWGEKTIALEPPIVTLERSDERTWWRRFCDFVQGRP